MNTRWTKLNMYLMATEPRIRTKGIKWADELSKSTDIFSDEILGESSAILIMRTQLLIETLWQGTLCPQRLHYR